MRKLVNPRPFGQVRSEFVGVFRGASMHGSLPRRRATRSQGSRTACPTSVGATTRERRRLPLLGCGLPVSRAVRSGSRFFRVN